MNDQLKVEIIIGVCLLMVGYAFGRYLQPAKVITKTVTQIQQVQVVDKNIKTVTHEVDKPDGTKEIDTTTEDKTQENTNTKISQMTEKIIDNTKPQWFVEAQLSPKSINTEYVYGLSVEHRFIGPIFAGAFANTDHSVGVSVGLEF